MWEAMMMLRLIASMSPRLSVGQRARHAATPAALPTDTLKGAVRLHFAAWRLSLPVSDSPTATDTMTAELHRWPKVQGSAARFHAPRRSCPFWPASGFAPDERSGAGATATPGKVSGHARQD